MKRILIISIITAFVFGSCVGDLDTTPKNETDFMEDQAYSTPESYKQGLSKLYGAFVLVGQGDPGESEFAVGDAGASELNRAFWNLQEASTDAAKSSAISDPWAKEINTNTWSIVKNEAIYAVYTRTLLTVKFVNAYLEQTTEEKIRARMSHEDAQKVEALLTEVGRYRSEARFIRAYVYWMIMDLFGNSPFIVENDPVGNFKPPMIERADLFEYIESELLELTKSSEMYEGKTAVYPRVDKGAVWGLLSRMYLNAKVYTGKERWSDAKSAAEKVIAMGYTLTPEYGHLFMGDNGENPSVLNEVIYGVVYDKDHIGSWGGTTYLINGALSSGDEDRDGLTGSDGWGSIRTSYEYALKFGVEEPDYTLGEFNCDDKRAMFFIKDRTEEMDNMGDFLKGWSVIKFSKHHSTGNVTYGTYSSTDYPMIRLGEIYLTYAEATMRAGGSTASTDATALKYLNKLRDRAFGAGGHTPLASFDAEYLIDERARELMWEGHRRTDLIRFGLYTSGAYLWPWKGGVENGTSIDERFNLYPLDQDDVEINTNLEQNAGY